MREAEIVRTPEGLMPATEGWFVLNLTDIAWRTVAGNGVWCSFEPPSAPSPLLGVGVHVLPPGETPGFYHRESEQEGFLVLTGTCVAVVEGRELRLGPGDYLHCPPGTDHITIGAGDGPCALVMVGTRTADHAIHYPVDATAARHGASVARATDDAEQAYASRPPIAPAPSPWPLPTAGTPSPWPLPTAAPTTDALLAAADHLERCLRARDAEGAAAVLHDDFALRRPQAAPTAVPRDRWLSLLAEGGLDPYEPEDRVVEVDGDAAAILQRVRTTAPAGEQGAPLALSDHWRATPDGWRLWRRHAAPLRDGTTPTPQAA